MKNDKILIDSQIAEAIVKIINDSVGDRIKEDIRKNGLKTRNSVPARIWDFLNSSLIDCFGTKECMSYRIQRGPWQMVMVYDDRTGCILTFMRENRFLELSKDSRRAKIHYLDLLTRYLNSDLIGYNTQISMFNNEYDDKEKLREAVNTMLQDLYHDGDVIRRHVLILFDSVDYTLNSVRAVLVDANLNVVAEDNWSKYIEAGESAIAEHIDDPNSARDNPSRGLKLTRKAVERKKSNPLKKSDIGKEV